MIRRLPQETARRDGLAKRALLIGAGAAGRMVAGEMSQRADLGVEVAGFVDDDREKGHSVIQGIEVVGGTSQIPELARRLKIDEAIITIANASSREIRRIVDVCEAAGLKVRIVPGFLELADRRATVSGIRKVNIDDLLGRSVAAVDNHLPEVDENYRGKVILVTGAGGSIGSELCRQLCAYSPREIILLDKDENSVFEIDSELRARATGTRCVPIVGNIKNVKRLESVFAEFRPDVVFHAAAHKHVPLMESNVGEAVLNNVQGTMNAARAADRYGVGGFVFISSDKAVNPSSVMGATKRIGEIVIQDIAARSGTRFSCVRCGNVLGSRGSVVPLFQKQIARGGPVTVTHPAIERYFMSVGEAVSLILQAGCIGTKGDIFVLDMGKRVKIADLARDLMRLSGIREGDIEIKYTGLRPGEKLYEEILIDKERVSATRFERIFVAPPGEFMKGDFGERLKALIEAANGARESDIIRHLVDMGIGYDGAWRARGRKVQAEA